MIKITKLRLRNLDNDYFLVYLFLLFLFITWRRVPKSLVSLNLPPNNKHNKQTLKSFLPTLHLSPLSPSLPSPPLNFFTNVPNRRQDLPPTTKEDRSRRRTISVSPDSNKEPKEKAMALCSINLEVISDFQIRKSLKPLMDWEEIQKKKGSNPLNFRGATMVTTFVRSVGDRTLSVWNFLEDACHTDAGMRLAELEHPSLKKCWRIVRGGHPSFYRALKVRFPLDVGGLSRDGRVTTELGTGSLRQTVSILTPEDFRTIVDTEWVSNNYDS